MVRAEDSEQPGKGIGSVQRVAIFGRVSRESEIMIAISSTFGLHPHFWHRAPQTLGIQDES